VRVPVVKLLSEVRGYSGVVWVGLASAGCSADYAYEERGSVSSTQHAIVHGEEAPDEEWVVAIETPESSCTATLVAPNLIFTALHCVSRFRNGDFKCNGDGTLASASGAGVGEIGATLPPQNVKIYRGPENPGGEPDAYGEQIFGTGSVEICRNDFAVIRLDRSFDDVELPLIRMDRPMALGELVTAVGYGSTEEQTSAGRRRRTGMQVTDVGPRVGQPAGTTPPRTFVTGEGTCLGDSGGPAFSEETGALVGVYSISSGSACTARVVRNVFTQFGDFKALVNQAFASAGHEPLLEPYDAPPEPTQPTGPDDRFSGSGSRSSGCAFALDEGSRSFGWLALGLAATAVLRRRRAPPAN